MLPGPLDSGPPAQGEIMEKGQGVPEGLVEGAFRVRDGMLQAQIRGPPAARAVGIATPPHSFFPPAAGFATPFFLGLSTVRK